MPRCLFAVKYEVGIAIYELPTAGRAEKVPVASLQETQLDPNYSDGCHVQTLRTISLQLARNSV